MNTAIVTGANGFIGSHLVEHLLRNGWHVLAVGRSRGSTSWHERMIAALDDISGIPTDSDLLKNLHCEETDFNSPQSDAQDASIRDAILFHVAGDTRFHPPDPEQQRMVNVVLSVRIFRHFRHRIRHAVHVSTAYVAGDRTGQILESDRDCGQMLRNSYESSKLDAEKAVAAACESMNLPLAIARPSIIINDTRTGRSSAFTHFNVLVDIISRIQRHFGIGDGESVSESIRLPVDPDCCPNLAPVDPIAQALFDIGTNPSSPGKTFHLCHPRPQSNREVVQLLAKAVRVDRKIRIEFRAELQEPASWTERMIVRSLKPYLPYLNQESTFDLANTRAAVPNYDQIFAPLTLDYLRKIMEFQRMKSGSRDDD